MRTISTCPSLHAVINTGSPSYEKENFMSTSFAASCLVCCILCAVKSGPNPTMENVALTDLYHEHKDQIKYTLTL
jgi:hypothetical protein